MALVDPPYRLEADWQSLPPRSIPNGHASTLPMTDEQKAEAQKREQARVVGFQPTARRERR